MLLAKIENLFSLLVSPPNYIPKCQWRPSPPNFPIRLIPRTFPAPSAPPPSPTAPPPTAAPLDRDEVDAMVAFARAPPQQLLPHGPPVIQCASGCILKVWPYGWVTFARPPPPPNGVPCPFSVAALPRFFSFAMIACKFMPSIQRRYFNVTPVRPSPFHHSPTTNQTGRPKPNGRRLH